MVNKQFLYKFIKREAKRYKELKNEEVGESTKNLIGRSIDIYLSIGGKRDVEKFRK